MREIEITADELVENLLALSEMKQVCLLDSCGVSHLGSHLLIAGVNPSETIEITNDEAEQTLRILDEKLAQTQLAGIFTISYDFGLKLEKIKPRTKENRSFSEPDVFLALFDCLVIHDYDTNKTCLTGNEKRFDETEKLLKSVGKTARFGDDLDDKSAAISSNFTRENYIETVNIIQERIRRGDTYQTNLTQQFRAALPKNLTAQKIFRRLRKSHPAPFAAFLKRNDDAVVSISPERFLRIESQNSGDAKTITTSPIKGTRPRGDTEAEDEKLRDELLNSPKDAAENVMIVDLLRNDLGRICEFGSVEVEKLCDLETHPTLFHLVSTVRGELCRNAKLSDVLKAVFPCGSITGAPKINTMRIIDELETVNRGLSMGAIGLSVPYFKFQIPNSRLQIVDFKFQAAELFNLEPGICYLDLSVAIRTMVIKNQEAIFNVGGGIVIDSIPELEYEETLVKAKALLQVLGGKL